MSQFKQPAKTGVLSSFFGLVTGRATKHIKPDPRSPSPTFLQQANTQKEVVRPTRAVPKQFATPDHYKFLYSFSSYAHHGALRKPVVNSLMDLMDSSSHLSLLPRRRLYGNPYETLSVKNGDDAMIVSPNLLGVADGVSGWSGAHADSGLFARSFLENISRNFAELSHKNKEHLARISEDDLKISLDQSYTESLAVMEREEFKGSSTVVIAMIIDKKLKVLNIGDSRVFVFRDGEILATNEEQYIANLCPQQVGTTIDPKLPSSVVQFLDIDLQKDDLLMLCSDGVTDNLYPDEILEFVNQKLNSEKTNLGEVCHSLMIKCKGVAFDNYCVSPYVEKVNELNKDFITGGKLDDISVCLGRVTENI